jgi:hypothetical protein
MNVRLTMDAHGTVGGVPVSRSRDAIVQRASKLRLDAAVAEAFARFQTEGVRALLLKGASLEAWLYLDDGPRFYGDADLLVAPADLDAAENGLSALGYECTFDGRTTPSWLHEHSSTWFRASDGVTIDLHRSLPGVRIADGVAWRVLSRDAETVTVAGRSVPALGPPAKAAHVALHAAQHGADVAPPIAELDRALELGDDGLWRDAATVARELDAVDAFAAGLALTGAGRRLAAKLRLRQARSVETALRASTPPPAALGFEQLAQSHGLRARLLLVCGKLVPPPAFIRHWDPRAREGRLALVRAYLRRPAWVLRQAAPGFRAWYRARRALGRPHRI